MWVDRILARVGSESDADAVIKARDYRRFLLALAAVHGWVSYVGTDHTQVNTIGLIAAVILTGSALAGLFRYTERRATVLALGTMLLRLAVTAPHAYNHLGLEAILMAGLATASTESADESRLGLQFARWVAVLVLFWSGVQKALHGCYFDGAFLGVAIAANDYFAAPLGAVFPDEIARLRALPLRLGAGPFAFEPTALRALANFIWIAEIAVAPLLLVAATRTGAAALAIALVATIQLVARELVFGLMMVQVLLLFCPGRVPRPILATLWLAACATLTAALTLTDSWLN